MMSARDEAKEKWATLAELHQGDAWRVLDEGYAGPRRAYHSWNHIADMLGKLDALSSLAARGELISLAIFWHDAIYETRSHDDAIRPDRENVRDSADLFKKFSTINEADRNAALEMILATADHLHATASAERYRGFASDLDLFLDLDLSSLAAPWDEFAENLDKIRYEFAWVAEGDFLALQIQILRRFAEAGEDLFRHPETRDLWLAPAHANVARGLKDLQARLTAAQALADESPRSFIF